MNFTPIEAPAMFSATATQKHFREMTGSSSTRAKHDGSNKTVPDHAVVAADLREQLAVLERNRDALRQTMQTMHGDERNRCKAILANMMREIGDLHRVIHRNARSRFEELLVQVAARRLPKDTFLALVTEARELWRGEGMADGLQPSPRQQRKDAKREQKRRIQTASSAEFFG